MEIPHTLFDLYSKLKLVEEPGKVKYSIAAIVVRIFENLEESGEPVTAQSIELAFNLELAALTA